CFVFDLDGTLVDSVYQHVLAWQEAMEAAGIELSVWRIHRRMGMSGGLFVGGVLGAVATSGLQPAPQPTLELLEVPASVPVVTRDQVERAKPDPDLFLAAA